MRFSRRDSQHPNRDDPLNVRIRGHVGNAAHLWARTRRDVAFWHLLFRSNNPDATTTQSVQRGPVAAEYQEQNRISLSLHRLCNAEIADWQRLDRLSCRATGGSELSTGFSGPLTSERVPSFRVFVFVVHSL
jgi:hypothetical protein